MVKYSFFVCLIALAVLSQEPQEKKDVLCNYRIEEAQQLNFQNGDWIVFDSIGNFIGDEPRTKLLNITTRRAELLY